jgi:streptomycin 6-kinase
LISPSAAPLFEPYLRRWQLVPDGEALITETSMLLPVIADGTPAMLKIATHPEERRGSRLMAAWRSDALAPVLRHRGAALLLERGSGTLEALVRGGEHDEATRIQCALLAKLHSTSGPIGTFISLEEWFSPLASAADRHADMLGTAAAVAKRLLAAQDDHVGLHGDMHHGNVLNFGERGWRAIDPKGLKGERTFDYVNILRNPDFEIASDRQRLARQSALIAAEAGLDPKRLLEWLLAFSGLSAAWALDDGEDPGRDLTFGALALAALAQH